LKTKLIKIESLDGEIHFQECKANFCSTYPIYDFEEAINIAKKEAQKPLLLNQRKGQ
jgi:hypothetical protein